MGGRQPLMGTFLLCLMLVQFTISVKESVDSKLYILEILIGKVLKEDIGSIKDRLSNLEKKEENSDSDVDETVLKDDLQELVDNANTKTKRMLAGFSVEKEKLHNFKKSIIEEVKGINQHVVDIDKQVDVLEKKVEVIDRQGNETNDHVRLIDSQIEVIDKQVDDIKKQIEHTSIQVDNIDLQVATIDNQIGGIDKNLNDIDKWVKNIDNRVKYNAEKIQDNDDGIAVMKTDIGNLKKDVKAVEKKKCPRGWKRQLSSCILYVRQKRNWVGAQSYCERKGANLVEPISRFALHVLTLELPSKDDRWWIGGSDRRNEGSWKWESSRNSVGDVNWNSGEPNNRGGYEDCMELIDDKHLNDVECDEQRYIICEIKL